MFENIRDYVLKEKSEIIKEKKLEIAEKILVLDNWIGSDNLNLNDLFSQLFEDELTDLMNESSDANEDEFNDLRRNKSKKWYKYQRSSCGTNRREKLEEEDDLFN